MAFAACWANSIGLLNHSLSHPCVSLRANSLSSLVLRPPEHKHTPDLCVLGFSGCYSPPHFQRIPIAFSVRLKFAFLEDPAFFSVLFDLPFPPHDRFPLSTQDCFPAVRLHVFRVHWFIHPFSIIQSFIPQMLMGTMLSCGGPIGSQTESLSLSSWSYNQVAETDQSKNPTGNN